MGFREVSVVEIREVLRLHLRGHGLRAISRLLGGVDRKTVRRYVEAAEGLGLRRDGDESQLSDSLIGLVCERVRPARPSGHGGSWDQLAGQRELIKGWLDDGLTVTKIHALLARRGVDVPYRTLHRYVVAEFGFGRKRPTLRVADGEPGAELQMDFGRMGLLLDPVTGRRRVCWALIFTACYSRHCFVWLTFRQDTAAVIAGCEAAWEFFGGVFRVLIPDNLSPVVEHADPVEPRLTKAFLEYSQSRGFVVDACRVRHPTDKPRCERTVPYVRKSFWAGEAFRDLADAEARAVSWCHDDAGMRIHGTTQARPLEVFRAEEATHLLALPSAPFEVPHWDTHKVHRDHHIEVLKALYSVPGNLIGHEVEVRADSHLVKVFHRGQLIKIHPRKPAGGRSTDPADLPAERTVYALRDIDYLRRAAAKHGEAVGEFATALLDSPLPWTRMRQVYRLLSLVKKYGAERVDEACGRALAAEAVSVTLVGRMLERAREREEEVQPPALPDVQYRFARDRSEFALGGARR
jgi:transposase